jgi:hypothetical protein
METTEIIRDFLKFAYEYSSVELMQESSYEDYEGLMHFDAVIVGKDWQEELIQSYINYIEHDRNIEHAR